MRIASLPELKANLSRFVQEVRKGGEVQILDCGTPVARLVPPVAGNSRDLRERLAGQGMLRSGKVTAASILDEPPLALPVSISKALAQDRNDRLG